MQASKHARFVRTQGIALTVPNTGSLNPFPMSKSARRLSFVLALLVGVMVSAPAVAAERGKGKRAPARKSAPRKTPPEVKVKTTSTVDSSEPGEGAQTSASPPSRGPTRIDFDDRLIQGQTNKSGAVYLYDRKELKQRSMVKVRETFREEIVDTVYDR